MRGIAAIAILSGFIPAFIGLMNLLNWAFETYAH